MATFNVFGNQVEVSEDIVKYLEHIQWLEKEKDVLMSTVESMIKSKAEFNKFVGMYTKWGFKDIGEHIVAKMAQYGVFDKTWGNYACGDGAIDLVNATQDTMMFEVSALASRDSKSNAMYNQIVSEEFSRVKGLDFGIITSSFVSYMVYNSMNEKEIQKSQEQAYENINRRISNLDTIYQNQMLNDIDKYYVQTFVPALLSSIEKNFVFVTNKYLEALNECNQLNMDEINKIDVAHSQSLLDNNLKLLNDIEAKKSLLVTALNYCPFNINIYKNIISEGLLDSEIVRLMDYVGVKDIILSEIRTKINKNNLINSTDTITQMSIIEGKDRKEIFASYFKDEYDEIIKKFAGFAKIVKEKNDESYIRKLPALEYEEEIKYQVSKVVTEERVNWFADNCGFNNMLNEIAQLVNFTGDLTYENVIAAYVTPITEYAKTLFTKWEKEEEMRRIEEEKRKEEENRKRKELEEKRNKINARISEQEQIVADNKHKLFGQGAKMKKDALLRIEELKQELDNLR